ncbi:CvpA family protein [Orrella sp. NBD-18]|uniref:CvpA family protein n=1 Tax=Sheuella amnicola TaxID=2707330 RepID=A0A6B2QWC2_9BURK|nr:CvpA family protein [Sheuella amnicola]NDY81938.1 CvpA family protein [Sheuella amnicola]HBI84407.1 colicin V synthesis protein [Alcaligenaceae bacterium]
MTGFDFVLIAIITVSAVLGLVRGLLKEVLSLVAYACAFLAAIWWGPMASEWLARWIDQPFIKMAVAYISVFVLVLMTIGLFNMMLSALISKTGLTPADHGLGALFGLVRGFLFVLVLVVLAGYTPLPQEAWWNQAMFSKPVVGLIQLIKLRVPAPVNDWLPY